MSWEQYGESQPFIFLGAPNGVLDLYDFTKNNSELGVSGSALYTVDSGVPAGGIQTNIDASSRSILPQILTQIGALFPIWVWVLIAVILGVWALFRKK